ncbi:MAG: hypothetical protein GY801_19165 [bacterium]|nr:hypothetical protein [bacterium]
MMKCKMIAAVVGIVCIVSCTPVPTFTREPQSEDDWLVIGQIELYCHLTRTGSLPIGHYSYGVKLEFVDMESRRVIRVTTVDPKGFFYFYNPGSSQFYLKKISYFQSHVQPELHPQVNTSTSTTTDGVTASITPRKKIVYRIEKHHVNNLGYIEWRADMHWGEHEMNYNQAYAETQQEFAKKYPESLWNQREWVNVFAKEKIRQ